MYPLGPRDKPVKNHPKKVLKFSPWKARVDCSWTILGAGRRSQFRLGKLDNALDEVNADGLDCQGGRKDDWVTFFQPPMKQQ
jgi:hypothetical protein